MPNLVGVLKDEIRRLARKEVKTQVVIARRAVAQHRREIAKLKRLIGMQDRKIARLATHNGSEAAASEEDGNRQRFSARSVRAQRKRLGLSAHDYGLLVGVSGQTIYHWEMGKSRPRKSQFERLLTARELGRRDALRQLQELASRKRSAAAGRRGRKAKAR